MADPITAIIGALLGGAAAVGGAIAALPAIGFTAAATAVDYISMPISSWIGALSTGKLFAIFHSIWAAGIGTALGGVGGAIGTLSGIAAGAVTGGLAAVGGAIAALPALGFTAAGVAAGSIAAAIHSWIGAVAAGSWFAFFQSIGAAGIGGVAMTVLGGIGSDLGALAGFLAFV